MPQEQAPAALDGGPQLPAYTPPSLPPEPQEFPDRHAPAAGHESVNPPIQPQPPGPGPHQRTAVAGPTASEPPPAPPAEIGTSASPIPSLEDESRVARAASNRVEGNFKSGKKPRHGVAVLAAGIGAVASLVGGAVAGSMLPEPGETLAYSDDETTTSGAELDADAVALWADAYGDAFVNVTLDGCVPQVGTIAGVALDARIVLVPASQVESDTTPTIVHQDGTRHTGRTVGVLSTSGFAVVRLNTPLADHLSWGPMTNVSEDMSMRVATFSNGRVDVQNGTITQLRRTATGVVGMDVTPGGPHGSVILDSNNLVLGLVTRNGTFAADANELSPKVSNAVLNQQQIEPVCPVVAEDGEEETGEGE